MDNVNIAIIGAGRMGRHHGLNFSRRVKGCRVVAVIDPNAELAQLLAVELGTKAYTSFDLALEQCSIDAICISTPIGSHKELSLKALSAKKHVFCEKPLTLSIEDAEEIVRVVDASGLCYQLAFMRRFDDAFVEARRRVQEGAIGTPAFIRSSGRDPGMPPIPGWGAYPEACGDISFELCSHDYDSIRWLLNDEVTKVYAQAGILSSKDLVAQYGNSIIKDTIVINLELSKGTLGSIDGLLNIKYGYDARVEIVGEDGIIAIGNMQHLDVYSAGKHQMLSVPTAPSFLDRFSQAYVKEAQHFVDCISEGSKPIVNAADGLSAVKIAAAVNRSIREGLPIQL